MPRARTNDFDWQVEDLHVQQTAAAPREQGSGCLSGYVIPPLSVLIVGLLLAAFALRQPLSVQAQIPVVTTSAPVQVEAALDVTDASVLPADTAAPSDATPTPFYALTPTNTPGFFAFDAPGTSAPLEVSSVSGLSPVFTAEVQYWRESLIRWAAAAGLDPNLAAVVMQIESCGDPRALSRSGAIGLFQVMPFHFYAVDNPYDPDTNAQRGLAYLARSLEAGGNNPRLALAGYNGGIGVIARGEWTWSDQTRRYVHYGAPIYEDASSGAASSEMVHDWYSRYGASLCNQARDRLGLP